MKLEKFFKLFLDNKKKIKNLVRHYVEPIKESNPGLHDYVHDALTKLGCLDECDVLKNIILMF